MPRQTRKIRPDDTGRRPRSARQRHLDQAQAIRESLALRRPITNRPGLKAGFHSNPYPKAQRLGVPVHEFLRLCRHEGGEGLYTVADAKNVLAYVLQQHPDDFMAEWEAILNDLPEETVWTTESEPFKVTRHHLDSDRGPLDYCCPRHGGDEVGEYDGWHHSEEFCEEDPLDEFLPVMSLNDVFDHLGEDGWHIEGPGKQEPIRKTETGTRAYEVARELGVTTRSLIEFLARPGIDEHVSSASSVIAAPIVHDLRLVAGYLGQTLDARPKPKPRLAAVVEPHRPLAPRPGAPRHCQGDYALAYPR